MFWGVFLDTLGLNLQLEKRRNQDEGIPMAGVGTVLDQPLRVTVTETDPFEFPYSCLSDICMPSLSIHSGPETIRPKDVVTKQEPREVLCVNKLGVLATRSFPSKLLEHSTCRL